jgi:glutaredoxin-related protein
MYKSRLLSMTESFLKRMRWKAHFFLNTTSEHREYLFHLKTRKCPQVVPQLEPFESDMFNLVENIKFRKASTPFQSKLNNDIARINGSDKVFAFADKSRNIYEMDKDKYCKLLKENITSSYKAADEEAVTDINHELRDITTEIDIANKIETMTNTDAFISMKDHKENFCSKPKCRLINPAKNNLGRVSKQILKNINRMVRANTKLNQWRSIVDVIAWFNTLENKSTFSFIVFDVVDFYPSISENLLSQALNYASQFIEISQQQIFNIIMHSRKSLLFNEGKP